jgi:mannose-1-phosphate guanylyltransferase
VVITPARPNSFTRNCRRAGTDRIWIEPEGKNTAAAVGLATVYLEEAAEAPSWRYSRPIISSGPGQSAPGPGSGRRWAAAGYLVTFGIPPSRPETGYGYIKEGAPLDGAGTGFSVARFIEKPDLARAQAFLAEGGYYWNSGIFLFRRDVLLAALSRYLPDCTGTCPGCRSRRTGTPIRGLSTLPQHLFRSRHLDR